MGYQPPKPAMEQPPYTINFWYKPSENMPNYGGPLETMWSDEYFMVPRIGDLVYYNNAWWRVTLVRLFPHKPYQIQVDFSSTD